MNEKIDINFEARKIIAAHTEGVMNCGCYEPESSDELWGFMLQECALILTEKFIEGEYNPMQYNNIRNEVTKIINNIFSRTNN